MQETYIVDINGIVPEALLVGTMVAMCCILVRRDHCGAEVHKA